MYIPFCFIVISMIYFENARCWLQIFWILSFSPFLYSWNTHKNTIQLVALLILHSFPILLMIHKKNFVLFQQFQVKQMCTTTGTEYSMVYYLPFIYCHVTWAKESRDFWEVIDWRIFWYTMSAVLNWSPHLSLILNF